MTSSTYTAAQQAEINRFMKRHDVVLAQIDTLIDIVALYEGGARSDVLDIVEMEERYLWEAARTAWLKTPRTEPKARFRAQRWAEKLEKRIRKTCNHDWIFKGTSSTPTGRPTVLQGCGICGKTRELATAASGRQYVISR